MKQLGKSFGSVTKNQFMKSLTVEHGKQLTEQTGMAYHHSSSFSDFLGYCFGQHNHAL